MKKFKSPWLTFPVPSDLVTEDRLLDAKNSGDDYLYTKLRLIRALRLHADYYQHLPKFDPDRFTSRELNTISNNSYSTIDTDFYWSGKENDAINYNLFRGVQTFDIYNRPYSYIPLIRFNISFFRDTFNIIDMVVTQSEEDLLPFLYWLYKSQLLDMEEYNLTKSLEAALTESNRQLNLLKYGISYSGSNILALEQYRELVMHESEDAFIDYIIKDKLGFFGGLGGITNPSAWNEIATNATIADNRLSFTHSHLPTYIRDIGTKDFICYRFEYANIGTDNFLEVKWRFPQAELAHNFSFNASYSNRELITLYAKV